MYFVISAFTLLVNGGIRAYVNAAMAVINSENIRSKIWIALKRLDLNGWSNLIILCPNACS